MPVIKKNSDNLQKLLLMAVYFVTTLSLTMLPFLAY